MQTSLGNQALILYDRGDLNGAMIMLKEEERISRELGNKRGLQASLENQANILYSQGDLKGAMALHKEVERISKELHDKQRLAYSLHNRALILYLQGDLNGAMVLHKEEERIKKELGDKQGLSNSLGNQANILADRGDLDGAMTLLKEVERIKRELGDKQGLSSSLGNQALILYDRGDLNGAMVLHKEEERIKRELGDKQGLSNSLGNQANILADRGALDDAMALLKEAEHIKRELGDKQGLASSFGNQALILKDRGDLDGAMALHKKEERIYRELSNKRGLAISLDNQANILADKGVLDGAMMLHKEGERIYRELGDKQGLQRSLSNQANIMATRGELDGAIILNKESELISRELGHIEGIAISLTNRALIVNERNQPMEALRLLEEAYRQAYEHGLIRLVNQIKPILDSIREKKDRDGIDGATFTHFGKYDPGVVLKKDLVKCTVFAPPRGRRETKILVQVFTHLQEQEEEAANRAVEFNGGAKRRGVISLRTLIERGSTLDFELIMPLFIIGKSRKSLVWRDETESVQFDITIPNLLPQSVNGTVNVYQNSVPIGEITFKLEVTDADGDYKADITGEAVRYKKAFISYSTEDIEKVIESVRVMYSVGIEIFQDLLNLKPGAEWLPKLFAWIDESSIFLLFWSSNAKESKWVEKEWRHALELNRPNFIRPLVIEGPPIPEIPTELKDIQFTDVTYHLQLKK